MVNIKLFTPFEVSLRNSEAKCKESVSPSISPKSLPWKMRKTKQYGSPFFPKKWGLKPQISEISLGTKMNVEWFCLPFT